MVPRPLDRSGVEAQGEAGGEQNLTRTQGGVSQKQQGGCHITPFHLSLSLFGFSSYDRPTRTAPAERDVTGATPPFVPLARHGEWGGVGHGVRHRVRPPPRLRGGRSRLYVSLREGSSARTRAGRSAATRGPMLDRFIRAFLVVGGVSVACAWTWPGAFPAADPVAVLVRYHTPNVYRAVVVWYYVAPGVAVFLAGQFPLATSRIWFARMGVSVGLRSRLPTWPLSPTADGPAIVVGEVHHPVRANVSPAPAWLTIPERGLYTGVAIVGAVGSGKTSACMHAFTRQLLSWHATNPERRAAALVLEVKGDFCHDIRRMLTELDRGGDYIELSLDGRLTWNPLSATWLDSYSLAHTVASLLNQLFGKGKEPFWLPAGAIRSTSRTGRRA